MKLKDDGTKNSFEKAYDFLVAFVDRTTDLTVLCVRRIIRFIALPYCFTYEINWKNCSRNKLHVACDFLYIFFKLKYYPNNYSCCRLWTKSKSLWPYYYGSNYDPYQRWRFQRNIYKKENIVIFENKIICYELCKNSEFPIPRQYGVIYPQEAYRDRIRLFMKESDGGKIIIKVYDGMGGKGIVVAYRDGHEVFVKRKSVVCTLDEFELNHPAIVQDYVRQHPSLEAYSPSCNTVRVVTLLKRDCSDVLIIGAFIRFGVGASDIDNLSSGGIAAGVDVASGGVFDTAVDYAGNVYSQHPVSTLCFKGLSIPYWEQLVVLSKKIQWQFPFHKLLGLDICITDSGPVLIEINSEPDMVALEMTYGPILLREEVYNEFKSYDLLLNEPSRNLKFCTN
ncbi:hypothetical protein GEOBRER4_n2474 [Citrifermentans bremense]|uniref:ATP-grasp domain-containing protein n=2 Tax=Citrifermentans bremense TaxID=60035 RepID=A0A7R7IYU8_9BACT|nr:sugar-transfer associated ATP-grasp domain-containing protein [Citrifermentans bremense]BCO11428.1 hypothetical protein GEOBRER4_n2474 [Citrifermentans bremense]